MSNNATHFHLKPAEGRLVRDPMTRAEMPTKGERKPRNTYWMRRLRSGDVVKVKDDPNMTAELKISPVEEPKTDG